MCSSVAASFAPSSSSPAVTVTVCAVFHVAVVNVRLVVSSVRSVPEWPVIATVTCAVGCVESRTVYSASSPSVTPSAVVDSVNPTVSSSVTVTATLAASPA